MKFALALAFAAMTVVNGQLEVIALGDDALVVDRAPEPLPNKVFVNLFQRNLQELKPVHINARPISVQRNLQQIHKLNVEPIRNLQVVAAGNEEDILNRRLQKDYVQVDYMGDRAYDDVDGVVEVGRPEIVEDFVND